jgi:hypothetical protein
MNKQAPIRGALSFLIYLLSLHLRSRKSSHGARVWEARGRHRSSPEAAAMVVRQWRDDELEWRLARLHLEGRQGCRPVSEGARLQA